MISIIHPYYNHKDTFAYQFNQWSQFPQRAKDNLEIIVVDDGSPDFPCEVPADLQGVDLKVLRIEDDIAWNTAGSANLGISEAKYDWILHADFDVGIPPWCAERLLDLDLSDPKTVYWPMTWHKTSKGYEKYGKPHPNSFLMNKATFWEAGGYDEDFSGHWGCQDSLFHFHSCLPLELKRVELKDIVLERMIRCKDAQVIRDYDSDRDRGVRSYKGNWELFGAKKEGRIPQSTDHLRFSWHRVYP
jgi:hypothetical protein